MSLFGGGGTGGFGQPNNQQQQSTGFGGFGSNNNTGTGFGPPANTGFGTNNNSTGGGMFGSNPTNPGFGTGGTGFGSGTTSSPFGANRTGFGNSTATTSAGGIFGASTSTSGPSTTFGGFGTNTNNANAGGGIFGAANKPAFGAQNSTGGGMFSGGGSGTTFGQTNQNNQSTSGFGASLGSALGTNTTECQGTASTPFAPFTEKDPGPGSVTNHFQTISLQPNYKNFSLEELRLADYNQGRRFGNASGQAGAFGFSGFGAQTQNTTSTPFGGQPSNPSSTFSGGQTNDAFGSSNAGGGMFGQANKPATGMFGTNTASTSQPSGGLFGTSNNTGSRFGFGVQQQDQSKPGGGFSFGNNNNPNTGFGPGNTGFGGNNTANTGTSLFGANSNQNTTGFGGGQTQQPASSTFGGFGTNTQNQTQPTGNTFGGFGNNQQKPGGMFGSGSTTGNSSNPFGTTNNPQQQQQPSGGGMFGSNTNSQQSNSLFAPKPATTGMGLFGNTPSTNTSNSGGGMFASLNNNTNQGQQNQGSSLLGNNNQQPQQGGGLFASSGTTGGGFLGNNNNNQQQPAANSVFGSFGATSNQQQQPGLFGNSNNANMLNASQQQQQNSLAPPPTLTTSLLEKYPFGSVSIFDGLPAPPQPPPIPMATPINGTKTIKKYAIPPTYKINPSQSTSRLVTPRRPSGYGFTYSTYGTPSSVGSNISTPRGFSSSLLHSSIGRGLGKSLSTSSLRRSFDSDGESLLSPGAFSASSSRSSGAGSLKRLNIDRSLRTDLFGNDGVAALPSPDKNDQSKQPGILKKKVSFDTNTVGGNENGQTRALTNGTINGETGNSAQPSAQEQGFLRSSSRASSKFGGAKTNGTSSQPEVEQVKGNELAIVHEDGPPEVTAPSNGGLVRVSQEDPQPGEYYMRPPKAEIDKMSREQKTKVVDFEVGREGCGHVIFDEPVDLTNVPLDDIFEGLAKINLRSLTIYPDTSKTPPMGKGLNVPSIIYLENSWPRLKDRKTPLYEKSGTRFSRHLEKLRKVPNTEFISYNADTGVWVFKVQHFTTYDLDYDDAASEGDTLQTGIMASETNTPTPKLRSLESDAGSSKLTSLQGSAASMEPPSHGSSSPDDTFEFRKKTLLPGAFDDSAAIYADEDMEDTDTNAESFLGDGLAATPSESGVDEPSEIEESVGQFEDRSLTIRDENADMAGSFPQPDLDEPEALTTDDPFMPNSILKSSPYNTGTPKRLDLGVIGDWADELQRTISPRKQDRQALRESQAYARKSTDIEHKATPKVRVGSITAGKELATSIDLMNSIFGKEQARKGKISLKQSSKGKGFEWPYPKRSKLDEGSMDEPNQNPHDPLRPSWGPQSILLYSKPSQLIKQNDQSTQTSSAVLRQMNTSSSEARNFGAGKFASASAHLIPQTLSQQRRNTHVELDEDGVPFAEFPPTKFKDVAAEVNRDFYREWSVWELAAVLFDPLDLTSYSDMPTDGAAAYEHRIRKENLSSFWEKICQSAGRDAASSAPNAEERALAYLSAHQIVNACDALTQGKDYRLAILISQLPSDETTRTDMKAQIKHWKDLKVLSEITEPIRALYELLTGNTCVCEGKKGPAEDRARTFILSERLKLDWKCAFGLRLWYSLLPEQSLEDAIQRYEADVDEDKEKKPLPWFSEDASENRRDADPSSRRDVLWGLLKLYGSNNASLLADIVSPHNVTSQPLNARLSFQLYHALALRFPPADSAQGDQITWDFATQLESAGKWLWAIFAVLHLSDSEQRDKAIESLLAHHVTDITDHEFQTLTTEFQIPASWIWEAKALFSHSQEDFVGEVQHLLRAENWEKAYRVLCGSVGPKAIIEEDYKTLHEILQGFSDEGLQYIENWESGGKVYLDFVDLVQDGLREDDRIPVLKGLLGALPEMASAAITFEERVAVGEIGAVVGRIVLEVRGKDLEKAKVLDLPVTEEVGLKRSLDLGFRHYKAVMARGR